MEIIQSLATAVLPPIPDSIALPPLPPLQDRDIERLVFTHSSYVSLPGPTNLLCTRLETVGYPPDNEKLEHLGDALLGAVITVLLDDLYPSLRDGGATILKAQLVRDSFLAQLSRLYGFPARLIAHPSAKPALINGEKTVANLFEAYVAGLYRSFLCPDGVHAQMTRGQAIDHIEGWLRPLFTPLAHWVVARLEEEQARIDENRDVEGDQMEEDKLAQGSLARLNQHFEHKEGGIPTFEQTSGGVGAWTMRCIAIRKDGSRLVAEATRTTKQAAKTVAAWRVCVQMGWT